MAGRIDGGVPVLQARARTARTQNAESLFSMRRATTRIFVSLLFKTMEAVGRWVLGAGDGNGV